ncbi:hypothetical protein HAV15_007977 [Penicillium sp. str. |nr:hypothetical protein HAV15_007977 [Penicillium sp. str. \
MSHTPLTISQHLNTLRWTRPRCDHTQWTLESWVLRRVVVKYFSITSLDFHGMVESSLGQESNFIHALRADGGDSTYVPSAISASP